MSFSNKIIIALLLFVGSFFYSTQLVLAKTCTSLNEGDLFKVPKSQMIYRINTEQKRDFFLNTDIFYTWYDSVRAIKIIDSQCAGKYELGRAINYRPGSRLIKTKKSDKIYTIGLDRKKHYVENIQVVAQLYGKNWKKLISVIPDSLDSELDVGNPLSNAIPNDGQIIKLASSNKKYFVDDGTLMLLSEDKATKKDQSALYKVLLKDVREVKQEVFDKLPISESIIDPNMIMTKCGFHILWDYFLATSIDDAYNFINGYGEYDRARAVSSIADTPMGFYIFYRDDIINKQIWNWKYGSDLDDINNMLNASGAYHVYNHLPIEKAALVVHGGYYIFYSGENSAATWGWKRATDVEDMKNFINGKEPYSGIKVGTIGGVSASDMEMFYRGDKTEKNSWEWEKIEDVEDVLNLLNGVNGYSKPVKNTHIFSDGKNFYVFYQYS